MVIKICGITNVDDARCAVELGADILGFNFYKGSSRYVEPERVRDILVGLSEVGIIADGGGSDDGSDDGKIRKVRKVRYAGVFVNAEVDEVVRVARVSGVGIAQLHGGEGVDVCEEVAGEGLGVIKALRLGSREDVQRIGWYVDVVEAVLLDAFNEKLYGGTGERFDWEWLREAGRCWPGVKIFLAGGLNPGNIGEALGLGCYGIDLCSGVERSPGIKDHEKMRQVFAMRNKEVKRGG